MAAATVIEVSDIAIPDLEVVTLTASDGETYVSRKFSIIKGVVATSNDDEDAYLNATWSDGSSGAPATVTVNFASQTDKKVTLIIAGKLGN